MQSATNRLIATPVISQNLIRTPRHIHTYPIAYVLKRADYVSEPGDLVRRRQINPFVNKSFIPVFAYPVC